MSVSPTRDRRAERREATRTEILEAAWEQAREQGLAGVSLRDIAARIGMRPPSLYWYFASKHDIYDAMFAMGNRALLDRIAVEEWPEAPRAVLRAVAGIFVDFCVEDPARAQLMFERTIPDFEPSEESYALAIQVLEQGRAGLEAAGVRDPAHFDLWTALVSGLANQQVANDPGGERWASLIDDAVEMFANHVLPRRRTRSKQ